jgi:hypothetical protein
MFIVSPSCRVFFIGGPRLGSVVYIHYDVCLFASFTLQTTASDSAAILEKTLGFLTTCRYQLRSSFAKR